MQKVGYNVMLHTDQLPKQTNANVQCQRRMCRWPVGLECTRPRQARKPLGLLRTHIPIPSLPNLFHKCLGLPWNLGLSAALEQAHIPPLLNVPPGGTSRP